MCMQCMMSAMTSATAATGIRSWLATRQWSWLTPLTLKRITIALLVIALVTSALIMDGSTRPTA